ncbi:hypothetical protein D3C84_891530 [compost metagenome]
MGVLLQRRQAQALAGERVEPLQPAAATAVGTRAQALVEDALGREELAQTRVDSIFEALL